jgi:MFS family permease
MSSTQPIHTDIPNRLDRLPWSRWHWLIITGLATTWILDGLEVTLAGAIGGVIRQSLKLSDTEVGATATFYLLGAVVGALFFGYATDRLGRKKLFTITLAVYLVATAASALSWNFWSYSIFRAITGMGIGGEYAAINSAIDELIPARLRGHVDLMINATYWMGAAIGSAATIILLNSNFVPSRYGWRLVFLIGASIGLVIIFIRHFVPESPRWLMIHGRTEEANKILDDAEAEIETSTGIMLAKPEGEPLIIYPHDHTSWKDIWVAIAHTHRERSFLGLSLMIAQAFFYNAIFFTYALLLVNFYGVAPEKAGYYLLPFALGNLLGPIVLGKLFDTIGRMRMIAGTYCLSGVLLAISGWLFMHGFLTARTQTVAWTLIFFVASCAASSAYLTVSEIFPLEIRAFAISIFYAVGTLVGGVAAPALFGALIGTGSRTKVFEGYLFAAILMICAAAMERKFGVHAEQKSLEAISAPLSSSGEHS